MPEEPEQHQESRAAPPAGAEVSDADTAPDAALAAALAAKRRKRRWREVAYLAAAAIVLTLVFKSFVVQVYQIPTQSMENTLLPSDRVLVDRLSGGIGRGEVIVFSGYGSWGNEDGTPETPPASNPLVRFWDGLLSDVGLRSGGTDYIKRVIGLPGDHVACCDAAGQVTVNGVPLSESSYLYPGNAPSTQKFSITVPAGRLWVMGDHRLVSYDSRGHMGDPGGGTIPESAVLGRAFVIIWPPSRWGFLNIPATFEQPKLNASNAAAGGSAAALDAALDNGTPVRAAASPLPLALGFAGAVPITWLQRRARRRLKSRRERRS